MTRARIAFQLSVPVEVRPDDVGYISRCPALDVYSQGDTEQEAKDNLNEALRLFVTSCYRRGTLEQVLKDCGFEPDADPAPPEDAHVAHVPCLWSPPVPRLRLADWRSLVRAPA